MKANPISKGGRRLAKPEIFGASAPQNQSKNSPPPTPEEIASRAYLHFQGHGAADGHDVEDWMQAEAELTLERRIANSV